MKRHIPLILLIFICSCQTTGNQNNNSASTTTTDFQQARKKTTEELRQELKVREQSDPTLYLSTKATIE